MMTFNVTDEQEAKIAVFRQRKYKEKIEEQKLKITPDNSLYSVYSSCWESGYPYLGAIGGGTTFSFSGTSLGMVVKVEILGEILDVTDYEDW